MSHSPDAAHHNPIPKYLAVFAFLGVVTAFEALPLFGLLAIPAVVLLVLSFIKFCIVVLIFMHLWGDHPMFWRVFWIPLVMVVLTLSVLMALANTWTLSYGQIPSHEKTGAGVVCEKVGEGEHAKEHCYARDLSAVVGCYSNHYQGQCAAWVKSPITNNLYCSSPLEPDNKCQTLSPAMATASAYIKDEAADPRFVGFADKSAEEKKAVLMEVGKESYGANCAGCHQADGSGVGEIYPPLAKDPMVNGPAKEHIQVVLQGLKGKTINGVAYTGVMTPMGHLSDEILAAAITYERNSWGNAGSVVEPSEVKAARK
jgi:mono/diheme cytochrome c family protein/cytochrome c oxidase subunit IV